MNFITKVVAEYQGWSNHQTYNMNLLIGNSKKLYSAAMKSIKAGEDPNESFIKILKAHGINESGNGIDWQEIADYLTGDKKGVEGRSDKGWTNGATFQMNLHFANEKNLYNKALQALRAGEGAKALQKLAQQNRLMAGKEVNWQEIAEHILNNRSSKPAKTWLDKP